MPGMAMLRWPGRGMVWSADLRSGRRSSGHSPMNLVVTWRLESLVTAIMALPNVVLRGLMIIPQTGNHFAFNQLAEIRQQLLATIPALDATQFDTLSMGMSADMDEAIRAGSTMVRVGTAIFGQRNNNVEILNK